MRQPPLDGPLGEPLITIPTSPITSHRLILSMKGLGVVSGQRKLRSSHYFCYDVSITYLSTLVPHSDGFRRSGSSGGGYYVHLPFSFLSIRCVM
mmetsp:Transcript_13594/g.29535  ORF Transcript_13594/g.29535 Transcript_13594/m.29535 type:complete len:94 (-) Transcript_13594:165-446(-)